MILKATIEKGRICFNAADLIDSLDDEGRKEIIELLACHDAIIMLVAMQIVEGWTEAGYHGYTSYGPLPSTPLDKAKRYLAKSASDVAKEHIERLEKSAADAQKQFSDEQTKRIDAEHRIYDLTGELHSYRVQA